MRNTLIGIVIGIVVGIMAATKIVAPGLEDARTPTDAEVVEGAEPLDIDPEQAAPKPPLPVQPTQRLRVMSPYPPQTPILGDLVQNLQQRLPSTTAGKLGLSLIDPGTLNADDELLSAVQSGAIDAVFATPQEIDPTSHALKLFTAIPFGPDSAEYLAWFNHGGGQKLLDEVMAKRNIKATLCGLLSAEGGGWFREPVRNPEDFAPLTIRAEGFAAEVYSALGAQTVSGSSDEILELLEQNALQGLEYAIPSIDYPLGFQKYVRNFYVPGWHQPLTSYVLAMNADVWERLPDTQQAAIAGICSQNLTTSLSAAEAQQFEALKKLSMDGVQMRRWSAEMLSTFDEIWKITVRDHVQNDPEFSKIWSSLQQFRRDYAIWKDLTKHN